MSDKFGVLVPLIHVFARFAKVRDFDVPSQVYSASLLPKQNLFVCGGEDFKMYKFDFTDGSELGACLILRIR